MMSCRSLLVAVCLAIPAQAAAGPRPDTSAGNQNTGNEKEWKTAEHETTPIPLRWMPGWLAQAVRNAIDDATDPRDRAAER